MRPASDGTIKMAIDYIRDILVHEIAIDQDLVAIYNQKWKIPATEGMFIVLEYKGSPAMMSNRVIQVPSGDGLKDIQDINTQELISVSICSRNMEALQKKEQVLFAIAGTYAQQVQEANSFQVGRISPIEDLSELEGSGMLYRFEMGFKVSAWYQLEKAIDFYDAFSLQVDRESKIIDVDLTTP